MLDKASVPQWPVGPAGTVLNVHRHHGVRREPVAAYAPRSLDEHEHPTLQVSVLLGGTVASVGWHGAWGRRGMRRIVGGDAYVVPSGQPHDFRLHRARGMVNFHIDREALVAISPAHLESRPGVLDGLAVVDDPVLGGVAAGVHAMALEPGGLTPLYLDAAWTVLAPRLAHVVGPRPDVSTVGALPAWRLRRALDYIEAHLDVADLRVADVAAAAGLSPVHFTRSFARSVGTSPMQHIIARRLERGRERLTHDRASIAAIALDLGFGSHARFSEAFRRRYGMSPREWRRTAGPAR